MPTNLLWRGLTALFACCAIWLTGHFAYKWYLYAQLDKSTRAETIQFSIKEISDERYLILGEYTYRVNQTDYLGTSLLEDRPFRNSLVAEQSIPELKKHLWVVWYSSHLPTLSSLQKHFPFKEGFYSIALWGIFLYFIALGYYSIKLK